MKAVYATMVVGLWIYSVFLFAQWRMEAQARGMKAARTTDLICVRMYLRLTGLAVLAWLVVMMGP
jgi:hypothetical protein